MKFQRIAGRFAAGIMTGAILLTTFGGTALAEGEDSGKVTPVTNVSYKKTVTTDGNTYAPKTAFKFELTAVTHNNDSAKYEGFQLLSGVAGGLTLADKGELAFAPVANEVSSSYEKNGVIQVDGTKFTQPGVYHYKMKEIIPADTEKYEGIIYDGTEYDIYVFVLRDQTGSPYVAKIISTKPVTTKTETKIEKSNLNFTNNYGAGDNDSTHDLIITKKVRGNMGETNKSFAFKVAVKGAAGEYYKVVITEAEGKTPETKYLVSDAAATTFYLKDTGSIRIYGLTANDTCTVNEADYKADGYTTTYVTPKETANGEIEEVAVNNEKIAAAADGSEVYVINTRSAEVPGGVVTTVAPYALMLAFAGAMIFFFGRKRKTFGE